VPRSRLLALASTALLVLVACDANPYHAIGCASTTPLPPLGPRAPQRGIVCLVSDSANDAPLCARVAATFRAKEHPDDDFGVIVRGRSSAEASCKSAYDSTGRLLGDLPGGD
jgi:hypothetical protein